MRLVGWVLVVLLAAVLLGGCGGGAGAPADKIAPAEESAAGEQAASSAVQNLAETVDVATVKAVQNDPNVVVLDVREQSEYDAGHIQGVKLIPLGQVADRLSEIPKDKTVIVTCRTGNRSAQAAKILRDSGYTNIHNMAGGIVAWEKAGYPVEK